MDVGQCLSDLRRISMWHNSPFQAGWRDLNALCKVVCEIMPVSNLR
jgi:hypothetical protein